MVQSIAPPPLAAVPSLEADIAVAVLLVLPLRMALFVTAMPWSDLTVRANGFVPDTVTETFARAMPDRPEARVNSKSIIDMGGPNHLPSSSEVGERLASSYILLLT
jgi:hypothetical protein